MPRPRRAAKLQGIHLIWQFTQERVCLCGELALSAALPTHFERLHGVPKRLYFIRHRNGVLLEGRGCLAAGFGEEVKGGHGAIPT